MDLRLDATAEELPIFIAEVDEILVSLDEQLVRLEHDGPSSALLQEVFRAAHTIKGSSAAIGHLRMAQVTHAMETLLDLLRKNELAVSPDLVERLFESLDMLKALAAEVETLEHTDLDIEGLVAALEKLAQGEAAGPASQTQHAVSPTAPDGHAAELTARPEHATCAASTLAIAPASRLAAPPGATHHVVVELQAETWGAVRAFQVLLALDELGEVLVSRPSRTDIEQQQVDRQLDAYVATDRSLEEVRAALAEVPETDVLSLDEVAATPEATSPPTPSPAGEGVGGEAASKRSATRPSSATVRIDVERLDTLLNLVGELVIDRTRLVGLTRALSEQLGVHQLLGEIAETTFHLGRVTDELQTEVMKSRMLPIGTVFGRFPRVVRDLAAQEQKHVELVIKGQETELDRSVIEEIGDPLVHLLRNAVDHGVEAPSVRAASGKPEQATIRVTAEHAESSIVIAVEDDGQGIDPSRIRAKAVEKGIVAPDVAARLSDAEVVDLIFAPGFSTASVVTDVSGRGVGMDIVRTNVERLGGTVEVQTRPGHGTRFLLRLPLTLAIVHALLVKVGEGIYALPLSAVTETLRVPAREVQHLRRQEAILLRGRVLPIARLGGIFGVPAPLGGSRADLLVVAVKVGERQLGLAVDRLLGDQEVVIKALGPLVGDIPGISSAAILGDGAVALIVDVPALVQRLATTHREWRSADAPNTDALAHTA